MELYIVDPESLRFFFSSPIIPGTCATKVINGSKPRIGILKAAKRSSLATQKGRQKEPSKELSRILRTEAAVKAIEKKANSKKYNHLSPKPILEALDVAVSHNNWETALKIFGLLRKQLWYVPRCQTYTKLLMMLGKCNQPEQASLLFEIMQTEGLRPSIDVYTALVSAYGLSGHLDRAICTVNEMKLVSDCNPNVVTYSTLLNCCCKQQRFDLIDHILSEMSYHGVEYNVVTYNTIIDGYGKAEMFEVMESSLADMLESGNCLPDVFTLNSIIWAYGNSGQIEKMQKWYDEFQLMGIKPDMKTFNILIRSYGKAGMYDKIRSVMDFIEKRFFSPTIVTFNTVIEMFGKAGNIEKMDEYFCKMKHQGMKPNTITYCSLVNAYSKAGLLWKVSSILRQIENSDVVLDTPFFNCVISAFGQAGDLDKMCELFLAMRENNCKPDYITFATMIQAYNAKGMIEAAKELEIEMIAVKGKSGMILIF
ncbi:Pentatricopeptide repeat [Dillenia turbinata]|uniref:Pentatricopeptide repeat n=1 Tax=Dillenia turbinata TaxID=194707 RepID=A0AAN8ZD76_9MAGN